MIVAISGGDFSPTWSSVAFSYFFFHVVLYFLSCNLFFLFSVFLSCNFFFFVHLGGLSCFFSVFFFAVSRFFCCAGGGPPA